MIFYDQNSSSSDEYGNSGDSDDMTNDLSDDNHDSSFSCSTYLSFIFIKIGRVPIIVVYMMHLVIE